MKKALCILCSALMCLSLFSCSVIQLNIGGNNTADTEKDLPSDSGNSDSDIGGADTQASLDRLSKARDKAKKALGEVAAADMEGMSFIFTCTASDKLFGEPDSDSLSKEKYRRIEMLNEKHNVDIIVTETDIASIKQGLKDEKKSGMVYSHLLELSLTEVGTLSYSSLIGAIEHLPFIDLQKPYYDQAFIEEMKTPSGVYAVWGDACADTGSYGAVFYNEALARSVGVQDMESLVLSGAWTYDKLNELSKAVGNAESEDTVYGSVTQNDEDLFDRAYVSAQMDSVSLKNGKLKLNDNRKLGDTLSAMIKELLGSDSYHSGSIFTELPPEENEDGAEAPTDAVTDAATDADSGTDTEAETEPPAPPEPIIIETTAADIFHCGSALFLIGTLSDVEDIYNMKDVWGLLPMPNVSEGSTEYHTPLSKDTSVICYPDSSAHSNEIGMMIESLFACSYEILDAAVFDTFLHSYVRNSRTLDMLLLVQENVVCDLALGYGKEFKNYGLGSLGTLHEACTSKKYDYSYFYYYNVGPGNKSLGYIK